MPMCMFGTAMHALVSQCGNKILDPGHLKIDVDSKITCSEGGGSKTDLGVQDR